MNIAEILPELFGEGEKRVYYCQRCLNHGLRLKRKNHKQACQFRHCPCPDCQMVDRRRELNSRLLQIEGEQKPMDLTLHEATSSVKEDEEDGGGKMKERRPNCQRCAQHNVANRLKGHKRCCPFRDCDCAKCQVVVERQKLMADQIKLRRRQKKQKLLRSDDVIAHQPFHNITAPTIPVSPSFTQDLPTMISPTPTGPATSGGVCVACASQAVAYQHLMAILDPARPVDPISTLAAIMQACPHSSTSSAPSPASQQEHS